MNLGIRRVTVSRILFIALAGALSFGASVAHATPDLTVRERAAKGDFPLVAGGKSAAILHDENDAKVVQIAAGLLAQDIKLVSGTDASASASVDRSRAVIVGSLDGSALVKEAVANRKFDAATLRGQWESYQISVVENPLPQSHPEVKRALLIVGSDRRGAAYGAFTLSESIGVSPWVWWADVPPVKRAELFVAPQTLSQGPPSVKYRGIFINDEDFGLKPWAAKNFDPQLGDIGPKTYEKVFELLLRLRANFCWPAMHPVVKAFNAYPEDKRVADDYAIVMGASHCEPMLHNNATEWDTKINGEWNYETNAEGLLKVWDDRLQTNADFENVYTVGMRGIHDSGMPGGGTLEEKARRLERVIAGQRDILAKYEGEPVEQVPQIFCPYKEVLNIYRTGMDLPDDVTIVWADDNHGYLRQLSDTGERKRTGGSGVYYHLSYWGVPQDYLWLSSTSPALISYEMTKAYNYGADRLWVFNVGDIKPAEKELSFAMELAWDIKRGTPENAADYPRQWAARAFGESLSKPIGQLMNEYYRLAQRGKPEHINRVSFSPAQNETRLKDYRALARQAAAIRQWVPASHQDAYYQLVFYPVTAAALMNEKFLLAQQSNQLATQGDVKALQLAAQSERAYREIARITDVYNDEMADGKWRGMMSWHPRNLEVFRMPAVADAQALERGRRSQSVSIDLNTAILGSPMQLRGGVLSGTVPEKIEEERGSAVFAFNYPVAGVQKLWALAQTPSANEDSWFVNVNGRKAVANDQITGDKWAWVPLGEFDFNAGANMLSIGQREPNALIKALRVSGADLSAPQDALLTIAGADYVAKTDGKMASVTRLVGFGAGSATIAPITAPSLDPAMAQQAAAVRYRAQLPAGDRVAKLRFLPTSAINAERRLRAAVRVNGGEMQVLDLHAEEYTQEWGANVTRGYSEREIGFEGNASGVNEIEVRFLDPGLVLEEIAFE